MALSLSADYPNKLICFLCQAEEVLYENTNGFQTVRSKIYA